MASAPTYPFACTLCALFVLLLPSGARAQPESGMEVMFGGSLLHFDYRELNDAGRLLDREEGYIPGIALGLSQTSNQWVFAGNLDYHSGSVAYTGNTTTGIPISSVTQQSIAGFALRAEYWLASGQGGSYAPYLGTAYRRWERNILSTATAAGTPVNGLFETYTWASICAGLKYELYRTGADSLQLDLRLVQIMTPSIHVIFNGSYDDARLALGERLGSRIALPWRYALNQSSWLLAEPFVEMYEFGRSPDAALTKNGAVVGSVFEPYSQTSNYGLTLGISQQF